MSDIDQIRKFIKRESAFDENDRLGAFDHCVTLLAKVDELEKRLKETPAYHCPKCDTWYSEDELRSQNDLNILTAAAIAHRACTSTEHNPLEGKLHGACVVCGVDWPCETAKTFLHKVEEQKWNRK